MKALLITGTDTDVGKTVLTTALTAYWLRFCHRQSLGLMKLIETGVGDRQTYGQLFGNDPQLEIVVPLSYVAPLAPPLAAAQEGRSVDLLLVWQKFTQLAQERDFVLVEALGGLGSPVTHELTVADLARDWHLPTVLVVPVRLGALGQAVANVALARFSQVHLVGVVLCCTQPDAEASLGDWAPVDLIQFLTNIPVLGIIPYLKDPTDVAKLAQVASSLEVEKLLPSF